MKNIPKKIYLNIGEDLDLIDDFNDLHEVTWCQDAIDDNDIEYTLNASPNDLWRSVEDELPEEKSFGYPCVVYDMNYGLQMATYIKDRFAAHSIVDDGVTVMACVTHWMPLPQPPKSA